MRIINFAAGQAISSSAVLIFLTLLMLAGSRRLATCVSLFAMQSAVIAAQVLAIAYLHRSVEAFVIGTMVVLIKAIAIPFALFRLIKRLHTSRDVNASISPASSVFITVVLIVISFSAVQSYAKDLNVARDPLAAAVAIILTGCFLMTSRNKALMQILGLLVLENGIFMAALTTTFGMPLVIEIGIVFDLVMGVFLMGIFTFRIRETFDHLDVSKLRKLRG
jgi:hydrogenase-4 component E